MVSLEWYRSFIEVYRAGTVSAAARALRLTQPAVSQHLAALESAAGTTFFTRSPRRMIPTDRGKALYTRVVQSLERLEEVSTTLKEEQAPEAPLVRIGSPPEFFQELVIPALEPESQRGRITFGLAGELLDALRKGTLDLVIATQREPSPELDFSKLGEEKLVLVGSSTLKAPSSGDMESWIARQSWVAYGAELPMIRRFWLEAFGRRPDIRPAWVIPNLHCIAKLIETGSCVSVLPHYLCADAIRGKRMRVLWSPPAAVVNEIWLAWRKTDRHHPAIKKSVERLRAKCSLA